MASGNVLIELDITKSDANNKYLLEIKVTRYENIIAEIFVYQYNFEDSLDYFSHIASTAELGSLPKYRHTDSSIFYLDHNVKLEFETAKEREDTLASIISDVYKLKQNWGIIKDIVNSNYKIIV